jgi:hypothetical protein
MFKFNRTYFLLVILLLVIEIAIALYIPDGFIRHYVGDLLVVILIYCFLRSLFKFSVVPLAFGVLLFAYCIEILQYFDFVDRLGLSHNKLVSVVLGSTFDWMDMLMYTVGIGIVIFWELFVRKMKANHQA